MPDLCPFCEIIADRAPATIVREWPDAIAILPLPQHSVAEGHVLVLPRSHVTDFTEYPGVSAYVMAVAAEFAAADPVTYDACNVITSRGRAATQSVPHLHLHLVPRAVDDGLALPWYSGRRSAKKRGAGHA